jgi:YD repeat-containing protein
LSKLPATSVGSPPTEAAPAEAVAPVEERAETAGQRLRRAGRHLGRRLRPGPQLWFLLLFLALGVWMFAPAWKSPTTTTLEGGEGDPAIFMWFLRWAPYAIAHGHELLVTHHLNYPDGVNLMWNTSLPLPGLLLGPVTATWGPVFTFNLLLVLSYGLSAWCAYLAIRRFVPGHLAAAVGGAVYGFSPAMRVQSHHLHMTLAFLVPLMLLAVHEILVRQRHSPWLVGAALGLMAGAQLLIGEELLAMTALLAFAMVLLVVLTNLRRVREHWAYAAKALAVALTLTAAIIVWPLAVQFAGPQRIHGDIQKTNYSNDLQSFILPGWPQAMTWDGAGQLVEGFAGGNSAYLGLPMLLVLAALGVRWRSEAVVRIGLALMAVAAVFSLGPSLLVGGRDTGIPLPWAFFENLPLLPSLIPARLAQLTALFAGLLLALFLQAVWREGGWRRAAAVVVAVLVLVPLWPSATIPSEKVETPAFFTGPAVRSLPRDSVVLVLPWAYRRTALAMTWQAEAGLWYRMPGGYFIGPQKNSDLPRFDAIPSTGSITFARIFGGATLPRLTGPMRRALARDLVRWRVGSVVVGPMPNQAAMLRFLTELFGSEPQQVEGVYLWRDPVAVLIDPGSRPPS